MSKATQPDSDGPPTVNTTAGTRLWFAWTILSASVITAVLSTAFFVHNVVRPRAQTFYLWMPLWAKSIAAAMGVRVEVEQRCPLPESQPFVFVPNHQNMLDIITCGAAIAHPYRYLAKAELRRMPVIGRVLERSSCVFVDRSTPRRAVQSMHDAATLIREGTSVLIYPEGGRNYGAGLLPFLRGAFTLAIEAGVPVVPVVQLNNHEILDERNKAARTGTARMVICDPIPTAGFAPQDVGSLSEVVRSVMEAEITRERSGAAEAVRVDAVSSAGS